MKSGAPAFGTPEYMRATQISGQMARFYGLPLRASNACAANAPDAQAAWESAYSLWACVTAKANVVYHAAGWLEGGLIASYEKFVIDCETLQQVDALHEAGADDRGRHRRRRDPRGRPARPFLRRRAHAGALRDGVLQPLPLGLAELRELGGAGSVETPQRANAIWKQILPEFEPPPLDPAIEEELSGLRRAPQARRRRADGFLAHCKGDPLSTFASGLKRSLPVSISGPDGPSKDRLQKVDICTDPPSASAKPLQAVAELQFS